MIATEISAQLMESQRIYRVEIKWSSLPNVEILNLFSHLLISIIKIYLLRSHSIIIGQMAYGYWIQKRQKQSRNEKGGIKIVYIYIYLTIEINKKSRYK